MFTTTEVAWVAILVGSFGVLLGYAVGTLTIIGLLDD